MQTLGPLTEPLTDAQHNLQANAAPALATIKNAVHELDDAIGKFSGRNDNRVAIERLAVAVLERSWELEAVSSMDLAQEDAVSAFGGYRSRLLYAMRMLDQAAGDLFSDDSAVQFTLRVLRQKISGLRSSLNGFTFAHDNRSTIAADVAAVLARLDDVKAMNAPIEAWRYEGVIKRCGEMRRIVAEEIPTAIPQTLVNDVPPNPQRATFLEALDELSLALSYIDNPHEVLKEQRMKLISDYRSLRSVVCASLREPLNKEALLPQLQDLRSRYLNLESRLKNSGDSPFREPAIGGAAYRAEKFGRLLAMVEPPRPDPPPTKTLIERIGTAFGWGDEMEAA